jgi:thiamine-monophosphate kinase
MTNSSSENRPGEFELIAKLFAPLARNAPGAFGLTDDAAILSPALGEEIVVTADMLTEGVHFRSDDPPDLIARKALRTNLSDLAAKGSVPHGYLLSLALPRSIDFSWLQSFASGLEEDQRQFSLALLGGDTTATSGPLTIAITAFGMLPVGTMIRRNGAKEGDAVFVSGTIGDSGEGLAVLNGKRAGGPATDCEHLASRYRLPVPRLALGRALRGIASASLDVSDGLIADLGHIATASRVKISVKANQIPRSSAAKAVAGESVAAIVNAATAGDDYEIAFTAPGTARQEIARIASETATPVTEIGIVEAGGGVVLLDSAGSEIPVSRKGYRHF